MRLLDLFCGQGGCSVGYNRAGFEVVGVDIKPQPRYPYEFHQADAFEYLAAHWQEFDMIHASPPCQHYSVTRHVTGRGNEHPDLISRTREGLKATGKPYVIENVPGAPLKDVLMLCGSMFGLGVLRHRLFECHPVLIFPPASCDHTGGVLPMWWKSRQAALARGETFRCVAVVGKSFLVDEGKRAMGIDWMTREGLAQAIPPVYTEYVGRALLALI